MKKWQSRSNPALCQFINTLFDDAGNAQGLMVRHIYQRGEKGWEVVPTA